MIFKILLPEEEAVKEYTAKNVGGKRPCTQFHGIGAGSPTPTPAGVSQFNSVLTLSTQRQHPVPQVTCSVPQDCPPSHASCNQVCHPCFSSVVSDLS